jgi:putative heme-binding domain-containing protein
MVSAKESPARLTKLVAELPRTAPITDIALGLGEGLKRQRLTLRAAGLAMLLDDARRRAADSAAPLAERQQAILVLGYDDFASVKAALDPLLDPREPAEIQLAAVRALSGFTSADVAGLLLARFPKSSPALRGEMVTALLAVKNRLVPFLDAIAKGEIPKNQVPPARRALLLKSKDSEVLARVEKLFGNAAASPRGEVVEKYQPALKLTGDVARGRKVFEATCQVCHRLGSVGNDLGPNLGSVRQWSADQLLVNILDPNREVAPNYLQYAFELKSGETIVGLLLDETPAALTLRRPDNVTQTLQRSDLSTMTALGISLMPEGLETALTPQQMADLIAAIKAAE